MSRNAVTPEGRNRVGWLASLKQVGGGLAVISALGGCANMPLKSGGTLSSYDRLETHKGRLTKAAFRVDGPRVLQARTVRIISTTFSPQAAAATRDPQSLRVVANMVDRALCVGLSDRLAVVGDGDLADLTVRATVTGILTTDAATAGVSAAASIAGTALSSPVPIPRLPFGLGGMGVEAEAVSPDGTQAAAMVWSRGANSLTDSARASSIGDAYTLATNFGNDFSKMLVAGKAPFGGMPSLPSGQKIRANFGGKFKHVSCERFGRAPGLKGVLGRKLGLAPTWADRGERTASR